MIEIRFKNTLTKDGKEYKIISFNLLDDSVLPKKYLEGTKGKATAYASKHRSGPVLYIWYNGVQDKHNAEVYKINQVISEEEMKLVILGLKSAGKHLAEIMAPINKLKSSGWVGREWEVKI